MKDNNHSPVKTVSISGVLFDIQRQKHYVTTWCQATGNKTPIFRTKKELLNEIFEDVNYYGKLSKS